MAPKEKPNPGVEVGEKLYQVPVGVTVGVKLLVEVGETVAVEVTVKVGVMVCEFVKVEVGVFEDVMEGEFVGVAVPV